MAFIDDLAFLLFSITIAGLFILYTLASIYLAYKKDQKSLVESIKDASIPMLIIGSYFLVMGIWGQFTWTLPGSYNILFYDPLVAFGIVLLSFAIAGRTGARLDYAGFLGFLFGVMAIIYGHDGYTAGLTQLPIAMLGMFAFYGLAGVFSFPLSMKIEILIGTKKTMSTPGMIIFALFFLSLLAGSLIAGYIGVLAVQGHLLSPP